MRTHTYLGIVVGDRANQRPAEEHAHVLSTTTLYNATFGPTYIKEFAALTLVLLPRTYFISYHVCGSPRERFEFSAASISGFPPKLFANVPRAAIVFKECSYTDISA